MHPLVEGLRERLGNLDDNSREWEKDKTKVPEPIKAIETYYKGYRFRSRTEARWAVFFDAARIPWEFEKQGYILGDGSSYLPDFWIPIHSSKFPGAGFWLEIKGQPPSTEECEKCRLLALGTGHCVYLAVGAPGNEIYWKWYRDGHVVYENVDAVDHESGCSFGVACDLWVECRVDDTYFDKALAAARSARFEHGECP